MKITVKATGPMAKYLPAGAAGSQAPLEVADGGQVLVQPAGVIDEGAAERRDRVESQSDLVGDQHDRAFEPGQA